MIKYSFYGKSQNTIEEARELINRTDKELLYTDGFKYRNPTTYLVPITKEKALELVVEGNFVDVTEREDYIDINTYSSNDMY